VSRGSGSGTEVNLTYETILPSVELVGLRATDVEALAIDLSKMSETLGKQLKGVLGYSLLKDRVVQFDYPKRMARFYSSSLYLKTAAKSDSSERTTLSFTVRDDILVDGILVNGKKITATFDTGSNGTFQIAPRAIARLGLEKEAREAQATHSAGFNSTAENRKGKIKNITIGGISANGPEVVFFNHGAGYDDAAWGLRIGNAFLEEFVVTVIIRRRSLPSSGLARECSHAPRVNGLSVIGSLLSGDWRAFTVRSLPVNLPRPAGLRALHPRNGASQLSECDWEKFHSSTTLR
jgi:hypothetical protein